MTQTRNNSLRFNPASPDFHANLYAVYSNMRGEQPLARLGRTWILTRYHDIANVLKNRSFISSGIPEQLHNELRRLGFELSPALRAFLFGIVLFEDGERHASHRLALQALFKGEAWNEVSEMITRQAQKLATHAAAGRHFDGIRDFAAPLWRQVFTRWLNLPPELQEVVETEKTAIRLLLDPSAIDEAGLKQLMQAMSHLDKGFNQLLKAHLAGYDSLFFRSLVKGYDGDLATLQQRFSTDCITMLVGGSETSEALTGNLLLMLAQRAELQKGVQNGSLRMRDIVTETMRFESPLQMVRRKVQSPTELHGRELRSGDNLLLCLGSANRDESVFEDAASFTPGRKNAQRQLGFGIGMHQCIGQLLAQFQAEQMATALFTQGKLAQSGEATWSQRSLILRSLDVLPLHVVNGARE
ncbi:cytochrome P450 [Cedecea davisae]|uniref:cytochrome P450 n=1 Tax=Cedecea davisae TaxID=158484 RepID=UPI001D0A15D7|nr:cytochrome P450 [Cedecea davisae]